MRPHVLFLTVYYGISFSQKFRCSIGYLYTYSEFLRSFTFSYCYGLTECVVTKSCPTLCSPMDCSPPDSYGILQARVLEWIVIPLSRSSSWPRDQTQVSCIASRFFTIWATGKMGWLIPFQNLFVCWTFNAQYLWMYLCLEREPSRRQNEVI